MATYSFHRLIMGKVEIDHFFCLLWDNLDFFTEMFIEYFAMFRTTFVQIGEFDWLSGWLKGSIFVKIMFKYLLRNHKGEGAKTLHTYKGH